MTREINDFSRFELRTKALERIRRSIDSLKVKWPGRLVKLSLKKTRSICLGFLSGSWGKRAKGLSQTKAEVIGLRAEGDWLRRSLYSSSTSSVLKDTACTSRRKEEEHLSFSPQPSALSLEGRSPGQLGEKLREWKDVGLLALIYPLVKENQILVGGYIYGIGLAAYLITLKYAIKPRLKNDFLITSFYLGVSGTWIAWPALAQITINEEACSQGGLLSDVSSFVDTMFSTITFNGFGGGALSSLLCQVIGFFVLATLLSFLGTAAVAAYRINQGETVGQALQPMIGFLIFAGMGTVMVTTFVGGGTTTN